MAGLDFIHLEVTGMERYRLEYIFFIKSILLLFNHSLGLVYNKDYSSWLGQQKGCLRSNVFFL